MTTPAGFLPTAGTGPVTQYNGTYVATVVNNHDPLGVGRLQLNIPQVLGNAVSTWAIPLGTYYSIPANGTTISATFIGGDPAQPAWNGPLDLAPVIFAAGPPTVTYDASAPPSPRVGDIWYQVLGGVQAAPQVWTFDIVHSTFSWVTQVSLGNAALSPDSVTGTTIAAGAIDGKIINGNVINGAQINGSDINITPGANNALLIYSTAAPAFKQAIINASTNPPAGTSHAYTSTAATTIGSAILVSIGIGAATTDLVTGVTDSKSNTYTRVQTEPGTAVGRSYQYLALNTTALTTSDTITVSYSVAPANVLHVQAIELTNVASASAVDTTTVGAIATGVGALSIASGTLGGSPEIIVGSFTSGAFGSMLIQDSVFSAAATQSGQITTWAAASTTTTQTNTVLTELFPGSGANAGCLVSLKNSGAPALLGSAAAAVGTDMYTNPFKDGYTVYHGNARLQSHVNATYGASGAPATEMVTGLTSESTNAAIYTTGVNIGLANESIQTDILGPSSTFDGVRTLIQLGSANKDGSGVATGVIYVGAGTLNPIWFWNANGSQVLSPGGAQWPVNGCQTDGTVHAAPASSTALQQLGKSYSIPTSDSFQYTTYRYTLWGTWAQTTTAENFTFSLAVNGFVKATIGIGSGDFAAGHVGTFQLIWDLQLATAPGSVAKWNVLGGGSIKDDNSSTGTFALTSTASSGLASGGSFTASTLAPVSVEAAVTWAAGGAGNVTGYGSTFERLGQ